MIKRVVILLFLCLPLTMLAQVTVSMQLPPAGLVQKEQLWNLVLVNNRPETIDVSLLLNLQDASTGQVVLSAVSGNFLLPKGVKMLNAQELQPIQYNFYSNELMGTYLPMGSYIACIRVNRNIIEGTQPMADECVRIHIQPLSPPLLNTPSDRAIIQGPFPQFSWLPPAPLNMFANLSYELTVAEVLEGQSPTEAMLNNIPVYSRANLKTVFDNYPPGLAKLDTAKQYAWQVTANNGMQYLAKTEVWTFSLQQPAGNKRTAGSITYMQAAAAGSPSGLQFIEGQDLYVKYYSYEKPHSTLIRILGADGKAVQEQQQQVNYGDNFFHIRLKTATKGQLYRFELTDQQKNIYTVSFGIK